jgi:arylsulfatase A-like enzyme
MDNEIGRVLEALDESGQANNTIVVLHGDHGWGLGENNHWHKMANYEDTARTALIIAVPFKPETMGISTSALVELVDMYPTIAALSSSGDVLSKVEGTDRSPLFETTAAAASGGSKYAFTQYPRCPVGDDPSQPAGWAKNYCKSAKNEQIQWMGLSVRDERWRATVWLTWNKTALAPDWSGAPYAVELYDYQGAVLSFSLPHLLRL